MNLLARPHVASALMALICSVCVFLPGGCADQSGEPLLKEGLQRLQVNDIEAAIDLLARAAKLLPDSATAHANLGIAYWKAENHDEAIPALRRAARLSPHDARPAELLGQVLLEMSRWEEARAAYKDAFQISPSAKMLTRMALVEALAGEPQAARALLLQALEEDAVYPPAIYNMAILSKDHLDDRDGAIEYFRRYIRTANDAERTAVARDYLREAILLQRADGGAGGGAGPEQTPEHAEPEDPPNTDTPTVDDQGQPPVSPAESILASARQAIIDEQFDEAYILLKQAVRKARRNPDPLWQLAVLFDEHLLFRERAVATYSSFLSRFPDDLRAPVAQERRDAMTTPVVEPPPREPPPAEPRAAAPPTSTLPPPARNDTRTALTLWGRGLKHHNAGEWDRAIACYKQALEHDSGLVNATYNLGLAYRAKGLPASARDAFARTVELKPDMVKAHYMLGVLCRDMKLPDDATTHLRRALVLKPDYGKACYALGLVFLETDRPAAAEPCFERYLQLAPDEASAQKARDWLKEIKRRRSENSRRPPLPRGA